MVMPEGVCSDPSSDAINLAPPQLAKKSGETTGMKRVGQGAIILPHFSGRAVD
jgi:hypothetical protein